MPARPELGSEIELAPNRKPYFDDETLEGPRLDRVPDHRRAAAGRRSSSACRCTGSSSRAVRPAPSGAQDEPLRRAGASELFETTANGGFNCAGCHGGMKATGGQAPYTSPTRRPARSRRSTGRRRRSTPCSTASATTRCSYILNYGRPFSPMSAWGTVGGGPMNDQQIETLIAYLHSIQIPPESCLPSRVRGSADRPGPSPGDLPAADQDQDRQGGRRRPRRSSSTPASTPRSTTRWARRCSTSTSTAGPTAAPAATPQGWSYGEPAACRARARSAGTSPAASTDVATSRSEQDMIDFIKTGSELGKRYGKQWPGQRAHARLRQPAHRRADQGTSSSTCGACDMNARCSPSAGSRSSAASSSSSSPSPCCWAAST